MNWMTNGTNQNSEAARERAWLVQFCARISGAPDVAEDLAQETLLEAWRHKHKLTDQAGRQRWLAAIARNVCLRWYRSHWRTASRLSPVDPEEIAADILALDVGLERAELLELLVRAMALLPPATRQLLVERYVNETPYRLLAERLGVSEDAVSMRLSRGCLQLRRVLTTELKADTRAYRPEAVANDAWVATQIWCQVCGNQRLMARLPQTVGTVAFRCPECTPDQSVAVQYSLENRYFAELLGGLSRPTAIWRRASSWSHTYFRHALSERGAPCTHCGRPVAIEEIASADAPAYLEEQTQFYATCRACGTAVSTSFRGLIITLPEVQRFWDAERRIRILPARKIEVNGQDAVVARFESVGGTARLDVVAMRNPSLLLETYRVIPATER